MIGNTWEKKDSLNKILSFSLYTYWDFAYKNIHDFITSYNQNLTPKRQFAFFRNIDLLNVSRFIAVPVYQFSSNFSKEKEEKLSKKWYG